MHNGCKTVVAVVVVAVCHSVHVFTVLSAVNVQVAAVSIRLNLASLTRAT